MLLVCLINGIMVDVPWIVTPHDFSSLEQKSPDQRPGLFEIRMVPISDDDGGGGGASNGNDDGSQVLHHRQDATPNPLCQQRH